MTRRTLLCIIGPQPIIGKQGIFCLDGQTEKRIPTVYDDGGRSQTGNICNRGALPPPPTADDDDDGGSDGG